jgi:hypothetical protein
MYVSGQLQAPAVFPPRERADGTYWIGGFVGPRAGLDAAVEKKNALTGNRTPACRYTD